MSSLIYGIVSAKRAAAPAGESQTTAPPAMKPYIDTLTALVPAETLALYTGIIVPNVTGVESIGGKEATVISDPHLLGWSSAGLLVLSSVLYAVGRKNINLSGWDVLRFLLPPASLAAWMLIQNPGVWDVWWPGSSTAEHVVIAAFAAVVLGILATALGYQLDQAPGAPAVAEVKPAGGSVAGGQSVTVTGIGFTGATGVSFDKVPASDLAISGDTRLTVTSPAADAGGIVHITVTTPRGTSATSAADRFTYDSAKDGGTPAPAVTGVKPAGGSVAGGQRVTVTGGGLAGAAGVISGKAAAPDLAVSADTRLTVTSPAFAQGVDFAYGGGVTAEELKAAGVQFVCRYLSGGFSKDISREELDNYKNAGIAVVLNWETDGQMPSEAQGVADAQAASQEAASIGEPDAPIIFSADFDPVPETIDGILAYMRGVASVLGKNRTGLYGGKAAVDAYFNAGIGIYGWQTSAWSGGEWDNRAQLQQYSYNLIIGPAEVDQDRAIAANFGQIGPALTPTPAPALTAGNWPAVQEGNTGVVVEVLQYLLNEHGASLTADGSDGPLTTAALMTFQQTAGITVDGIANGQTWPKLIVTVAEGGTGAAVKALQTALNAAGASLTVDGGDGPLTTQAAESFQAAHQIAATGQIGPGTWQALLFAASTAEEEQMRLSRPGRRH